MTIKFYLFVTLNLGTLILDASLKSLSISCLQECERVLQDELDPLFLCDLLFEEGAVDILDHDKVTEKRLSLKERINDLLDVVKKDRNNCFYIFLCILQEWKYDCILEKLKGSYVVGQGMSYLRT